MPEITPPGEAETLEDARRKFEAEKMSRRAALRKLGITSSMAFFSLFAVDDLARMTIKKMRQNEATRDIAETVAREFKDSGIAFAAGTPPNPTPCSQSQIKPGCAGADIGSNCVCCATAALTQEDCVQQACLRCYPNGLNFFYYADYAAYNTCVREGNKQIVYGSDYVCQAGPDGPPAGG